MSTTSKLEVGSAVCVPFMLGRADEVRPVLGEALAVYERKGIVPSIERMRTLLA